ncbi:NAD-dependent dehydratase [Paracidovorax avenae]|uniref:NAD-dependent epimerase/dehydratase family protein n=1 Tax=Paracidovorax avenae TaxID=80867 RepID=UPI000D15FB8D|nr:NAD-dependent epimerase/dehydratase family protein [Paracidovorax avenae]AVS86912.1 NAD-dependent dehydratase [Paracidovorax avenae]
MQQHTTKIVLPGGAGLVGQNLVAHLKLHGHANLVVLDKHAANLEILRRMHPDIVAELADLAEPGDWERHFEGADAVVMLQAQIGAPQAEPFVRNNLTSTERILALIQQHRIPHTVHISSSVVESVAKDHYTDTKRAQEEMVLASGIPCVVLRPTLMFGWFDRKHLGWLSRFMRKVPVFPIPGSGRYMRQPLYAADFCRIIVRCIEERRVGGVFNITGLEKVDYIDIIRTIKAATGAKAAIVKIPYGLFYLLLKVWALFDRDPPFTADQLKALVAHDEFEVIDWPGIFGVRATPFAEAIHETFHHPEYSRVVLEF